MIHSEFFSSKREANEAGAKLMRRHDCYRCEVSHEMRADMTHDWQLRVFDRDAA